MYVIHIFINKKKNNNSSPHPAMAARGHEKPFFPLLPLFSFWTILAFAPIIDSVIVGRLETTTAMGETGFLDPAVARTENLAVG